MNLFRSEEHARAWSGFSAQQEQNLLPVGRWSERFGAPMFRERTRPDYISWLVAEREKQRQG
jgi:hypothetical protein